MGKWKPILPVSSLAGANETLAAAAPELLVRSAMTALKMRHVVVPNTGAPITLSLRYLGAEPYESDCSDEGLYGVGTRRRVGG